MSTFTSRRNGQRITPSPPLAFASLALATTLVMSGCSSSGEETTEIASPPASASPSPAASESTSTTVPGDWQTVRLRQVAELSIPADWTLDSLNERQHTLQAPIDVSGFPPVSAIAAAGTIAGGDPAEELESSAKWVMENDYSGYENLKRLPNEVINGTTFYRLQFESASDWYDVYGTVTPDAEYQISIGWKSMKTVERKQAEAIWSPVMPTFRML